MLDKIVKSLNLITQIQNSKIEEYKMNQSEPFEIGLIEYS